MSETIIRPMTPQTRAETDNAFDKRIEELKSCQQNSLVKLQIGSLLEYKRIIHNLPDGFPLPFEKNGE